MKMRKIISMATALCMTFALASCGSKGGTEEKAGTAKTDLSDEKIVIGSIAPMTGSAASFGVACDNGVRLAVEEINANGGILGAQVEVITKDDQGTPAEAVSGFNALLGEGVTAIVGAVISSCTSAITELANEEEVVMITASSTADSITTEDDYVFRSCFKDSFQGEMIVEYAKEKGLKKGAILYATGDPYSSGLRDTFVKCAESAGIEIVAEQSTSDMAAVDFSSQLSTIVAANPDFIFTPYYYSALGPYILPQMRAAGYDGIVMGPDGFDGMESYTTGDLKVYDNIFFTSHYSAEDESETVQSFVKSYTDKYGAEALNAFAALSYDAMYMIKQAIEEAGTTDSAAIRDAMSGMNYVGVTGDMTLDESGTPEKPVAILTFEQQGDKVVQKFVTTQAKK